MVDRFVQNEGFYDTFTVDGRPPKEGELFRCPAMADTLEEICASQGESFYRGDLAQKIATVEEDEVLFVARLDWCPRTPTAEP